MSICSNCLLNVYFLSIYLFIYSLLEMFYSHVYMLKRLDLILYIQGKGRN